MVDKEERKRLYQGGNPEHWQYELENRKDWQIAVNWISKYFDKGAILDIGCWNGNFLATINKKDDWKLYGVEINPVASSRAIDNGITIISKDFYDMSSLQAKFDVVTAFDVIEHSEDPLGFIASACEATKDEGLIIISSGNTKAMSWRISGSRYWYCSIPEHLCFMNMIWYYFVAKKLGLRIEHAENYCHATSIKFVKKCLVLGKNIAYLVVPQLFGKLREIKHLLASEYRAGNNYNYPPSWVTSKDHLIVIFRKNRK
jgi:SAM-dependent methyltransferase